MHSTNDVIELNYFIALYHSQTKKQIAPTKIIGMPKIAPKPVRVKIVPTMMFNNPTAFRVGFQNKGRIRAITIRIIVGSIAMQ